MADLSKQLAKPVVDELSIINSVADAYGLDEKSRRLLYAIRKAENGAQGKEFGVLNSEAMRFADDPDPAKSFKIQAMWAAGTIKKRFKGDLKSFADRWAPIGAENDPEGLNKNWLKNIEFYMEND
jgi:hypothetical protein